MGHPSGIEVVMHSHTTEFNGTARQLPVVNPASRCSANLKTGTPTDSTIAANYRRCCGTCTFAKDVNIAPIYLVRHPSQYLNHDVSDFLARDSLQFAQ
jgi:hypothetical protein